MLRRALIACAALLALAGPAPGEYDGGYTFPPVPFTTCPANQFLTAVAPGGNTCAVVAAGGVTGLAAIATSGSAADLVAGNIPVARFNSGTGASSTTCWFGDATWKSCTAVGRELLLADRVYYVRSDGSSTNCTGLTDAAYVSGSFPQNCAFGGAATAASWQFAVNTAAVLDFNGHTITIQHGAEGVKIFTAVGVSITIPPLTGGGSLAIKGSATPGNTTFSCTVDCFILSSTGAARVVFDNFKAETAAGSGLFNVTNQSIAAFGGGINFGNAGFSHVYVHDNQAQALLLNANYTISGSASSSHIFINGGMVFLENSSITTAGTPNFPGSFVAATNGGKMQATTLTFGGTGATGPRYSATANAVINVFGQGIAIFPGSVVGTTASGGTYVP